MGIERWLVFGGSWGSALAYGQAHPEVADQFGSDAVALVVGRLESHYFLHDSFLTEDQLIRNVGRIAHLPGVIIQGRYDAVCPALSAWRLHRAWPQANFQMIEDAGHAAFEPGIAKALVAASEQFKRTGALSLGDAA